MKMTLINKLKSIGRKYLVPAILTGIVALGSYGCSRTPEKDDIVVYKEYQPMRTYFNTESWPGDDDLYIDDEDYIVITGKIPSEKEDTYGACKYFSCSTIYVSKEIYERLKIGEAFDTSLPYKLEDKDRKFTHKDLENYIILKKEK